MRVVLVMALWAAVGCRDRGEEVPANANPVISGLSAAPSVLAPDGTAALRLTVSDPDGDPVEILWTATGGFTVTPDADPTTATLLAPGEALATGEVSVSVADDRGGEAAATLLVSTSDAVANEPPTISALSVAPSVLDPGGSGAALVTAADPEDGALTYAWTATGGFTVTGTGDAATVAAPATAGASGTVRVDVTDEGGATAFATVVVATASPADDAPVLATISATPPTVAPGGTIALAASGADPEGEALTWAWTAPTGWTVSPTDAPDATLTAPNQPGAVATISVRVEDPAGNGAIGTIGVSVRPNTAPTVGSVQLSPAAIAAGGTSALTASASDPDGDPLTLAWTASGGFTVTPGGDPSTATLTAPGTRDTEGTVRFTATDAYGASASASLVVRTLPNQRPVLGSVVATPAQVTRGGTLSLRATASDPDGDALTYAWTAPSGWALSGSGATVSLTAPNEVGRNDVVTVVVSNPSGATASGAVAVSTSTNRAPVVGPLAVSGSPSTPGGAATVTATASDADGDALTYTWAVTDPAFTVSGSGASVDVIAPSAVSRNVLVTLTVTDPSGASASAVAAVTTTAACGLGDLEDDGACLDCDGGGVLSLDPVAFWPLDGQAGDELTGAHAGTFGTSVATGRPGPTGGAIRLVADVNSYLLANPFVGFPTTAFTVAMWVRGGPAQDGSMFSYATATSFNELIVADLSDLTLYLKGVPTATGLDLADGAWHHLAVTWRASDGRLQVYADGVLEWSGNAGGGNPLGAPGAVVLGQDQDSLGGGFVAADAFDGLLAEVGVFDRVLGVDDLSLLARLGTCGESCNGADDDGDGETDEDWYGAAYDCAAVDCADVRDADGSVGDFTYSIDPTGGSPFLARCDMTTDGGGWTLVGSFVNTDGAVRWSRPAGAAAWTNTTTFGDVRSFVEGDHKSRAFSEVPGTDVLVKDAYGSIGYRGVLTDQTLRARMASYSTCQTTAARGPGNASTVASTPILATSAMLTFYAGDPNASNGCAFSGVHNDSTMIAIGGHGCGTIGLGQWGTNYTPSGSGMDWHARLDPTVSCAGCDTCGNWYGSAVLTSTVHSNNAGAHDASTWGTLYVR